MLKLCNVQTYFYLFLSIYLFTCIDLDVFYIHFLLLIMIFLNNYVQILCRVCRYILYKYYRKYRKNNYYLDKNFILFLIYIFHNSTIICTENNLFYRLNIWNCWLFYTIFLHYIIFAIMILRKKMIQAQLLFTPAASYNSNMVLIATYRFCCCIETKFNRIIKFWRSVS